MVTIIKKTVEVAHKNQWWLLVSNGKQITPVSKSCDMMNHPFSFFCGPIIRGSRKSLQVQVFGKKLEKQNVFKMKLSLWTIVWAVTLVLAYSLHCRMQYKRCNLTIMVMHTGVISAACLLSLLTWRLYAPAWCCCRSLSIPKSPHLRHSMHL